MSNAIMSGNIDQLELSVTGSSVHSSSSPSSSPSVETTRTPHASHPIPSWRNPDPWSEGGSSQYRIGVTVGSMGGRRYTRGDRPSILVSAERQRARGVGGHLRFPYMRDSSFLLLCFSRQAVALGWNHCTFIGAQFNAGNLFLLHGRLAGDRT